MKLFLFSLAAQRQDYEEFKLSLSFQNMKMSQVMDCFFAGSSDLSLVLPKTTQHFDDKIQNTRNLVIGYCITG